MEGLVPPLQELCSWQGALRVPFPLHSPPIAFQRWHSLPIGFQRWHFPPIGFQRWCGLLQCVLFPFWHDGRFGPFPKNKNQFFTLGSRLFFILLQINKKF